jgi:hypothetical protein
MTQLDELVWDVMGSLVLLQEASGGLIQIGKILSRFEEK